MAAGIRGEDTTVASARTGTAAWHAAVKNLGQRKERVAKRKGDQHGWIRWSVSFPAVVAEACFPNEKRRKSLEHACVHSVTSKPMSMLAHCEAEGPSATSFTPAGGGLVADTPPAASVIRSAFFAFILAAMRAPALAASAAA